MIGWKPSNLSNKPLSSLMSDEFGACHAKLVAEKLAEFKMDYFGTLKPRIVRDMQGTVYRECDVTVNFVATLAPRLNYVL